MQIRRANQPWFIAILAYALFFQALAGSIAHAGMTSRILDPAAAFDAMAALCLPAADQADGSESSKHRQDDQTHAPCCVLSCPLEISGPAAVAVQVDIPRIPEPSVFHPRRYVLAVALAPPDRVQPRGPPRSA